ncbi:MAG: HU family DNA-binding protein [Pseudomonadota bacterium]
MNKSDLIDFIAKEANLTKAQAGDALNACLEGISSGLDKGDDVTLIGFGTFSVRERAARTGRNPQTGKPLKIPASKNAAFKAGKALKERVQ